MLSAFALADLFHLRHCASKPPMASHGAPRAHLESGGLGEGSRSPISPVSKGEWNYLKAPSDPLEMVGHYPK